MKNPFLYDLAKSTPAVKKPSGTVQLAYEKVFPVVAGQNAAVALVVLKKGEPASRIGIPMRGSSITASAARPACRSSGRTTNGANSRSSRARSYSCRRVIFTTSKISARKTSAS
jgi:hypothetical protein